MDEYSPTPRLQSLEATADGGQAKKPNRLTALALLKVGLFEIFFVGIVLVVLFGTLNYFNILPVSSAFPNQLGWLPRQSTQKISKTNPTIQQFNNKTIVPSVSQTQKAKETLISALPSILASSLIPNPSQITVNQDKNIATTFISSWDIKESTVSAIFAIHENKDFAQIYLSFQKSQNTAPSAKIASTITSGLLSIKPKGQWACKPIFTTMTYCENFWEEENGTRRGVGMEGLFTQGPNLINGQPEAMIIFCEHSTESKLYSWKSCSFNFKDMGVL